jgi:hypothetical protein
VRVHHPPWGARGPLPERSQGSRVVCVPSLCQVRNACPRRAWRHGAPRGHVRGAPGEDRPWNPDHDVPRAGVDSRPSRSSYTWSRIKPRNRRSRWSIWH